MTGRKQLRSISCSHENLEQLVNKYKVSRICNHYTGLDQFAYREGHNSSNMLIKYQHKWLKRLDAMQILFEFFLCF